MITVYYLVDSMAISSVASRGISVSAPTYSGNVIIRNLTILGIPLNNNSLITCQALGNSLNTSIIQIRGQSIGGMFSTCTCNFVHSHSHFCQLTKCGVSVQGQTVNVTGWCIVHYFDCAVNICLEVVANGIVLTSSAYLRIQGQSTCMFLYLYKYTIW